MKKAITAFAFISVFFLLSQTSHPQVRIGIQGGLSVPNLSGGNNEISQGYSSRLAPNFGITAEFGITNDFSIQPEINFDGQGGQRNGMQPITNLPPELPAPPTGYYYANFKNMSILNYLEIPVLAKYSLGGFGFRFNVDAGPYVGFLLNATEKSSGTSSIYIDKNGDPLMMPDGSGGYVQVPPESFDASTDVLSSLHRVNVGIAGGVGLILPLMSGSNVTLNILGLYGLTNIQKYAEDGTSHTGNLIVSVGYSYEILGI